jgi:hydrazine synthase alpha subunit-like protein
VRANAAARSGCRTGGEIMPYRCRTGLGTLALLMATAHAQPLQNPILFVTQFPISGDFAAIGSVFANHLGDIDRVGRGGDLVIRYPDGNLRNLTHEAGFGMDGRQGANAIAVRDPAVSWDGTRAVFSMVIGAPVEQYEREPWNWQLYEATGLGEGETVHIARVANQPDGFNNVSPTYLSDGSILFVSDRPRNGALHLYPQLDEYEEAPTPTGLWRLDATSGRLDLIELAVSGAFNPIVDSFGRVLFTRWDHMQRDQQNDNDGNPYGTFNWTGEAPDSVATPDRSEIFPEPRIAVQGSNVEGFTINHFFPWMVNQDGSGEETLNHVGRHELHGYFDRSFNDDADLHEFIAPQSRNIIENMLQLREDPTVPGRYYGIDAPEFYTHASGQIVSLDAAPGVNAATIEAAYGTPRSTAEFYDDGNPPADFTGHYRNPLPLADGRMIATHSPEARRAGNDGTRENPVPRYIFQLKRLASSGGYLAPVENLTGGIVKTISYWDPDVLVSYTGPLWELSPVEVRARTTPAPTGFALQAPEQAAFADESVDLDAFRAYLRANGLAVLVMRNVTSRDSADEQQPYDLRVPGGVETVAGSGIVYDIAHMQFFQGDQIRGLGGYATPSPGRRVLAEVLHDPSAMHANAANPGGPDGSAPIFPDGSVAMFVPASRALAWHSTSAGGTPVVRERYWIGFQPGEVRACDGCHGVNQQNQAGDPPATNEALALRALLARWRDHSVDLIFAASMEPR